jgi:hypothetical protein
LNFRALADREKSARRRNIMNRKTLFIKSFNIFSFDVREDLKKIFSSFPQDRNEKGETVGGAYISNIENELNARGEHELAKAICDTDLEQTYIAVADR